MEGSPTILPEQGVSPEGAAGPAPPARSRRPLEGVARSAAGVSQVQGRFIWQLVGVLAMKAGNSFTGLSVMPVFSGL